MYKLIDILRDITPLALRTRIGPYIGYVTYWYRTRIQGRTWEPHVLTIRDTIREIRNEELSVIRFGDGELSLMRHANLGFQTYDLTLAQKLQEIIAFDDPQLLLCVPGIFERIEHFTPTAFWFEIHHLFRHGKDWRALVSRDRTYGDAFITRPYLTFKDKRHVAETYAEIRSLWQNKNIVIIEGAQSRLGVGNDLFANTASIKRILCPSENAYAKIDMIIAEAVKLPKEKLILLSLGPTAKVVGYELFRRGYRVLDVGHLDMEYEMFLRNSDHIVPVRYKYFNEINERTPEACNDPEYASHIIATIS